MLRIGRAQLGKHRLHRPVLSDDVLHPLRTEHLHGRISELHLFQRFQLLQPAPRLGRLDIGGLLLDDLPADLVHILLMALLQTVGNLPLQLLLHGAPRQQIRELFLQIVQHQRDLLIRRRPVVIPALQDQPLHPDEAHPGIFIMNIFQCIIPPGAHNELLRPHQTGINAVHRVDLPVQIIRHRFIRILIPAHEPAQQILDIIHPKLPVPERDVSIFGHSAAIAVLYTYILLYLPCFQ